MTQAPVKETGGFVRGLNLFDATMIVIGTMIGSGIFIVSADMARLINSPGWLLLTWTNSRGLEYGKIVQNIFTTAKVAAIAALMVAGVLLGRSAEAIQTNFSNPFIIGAFDASLGVAAGTAFGLMIAIGVAQSGS